MRYSKRSSEKKIPVWGTATFPEPFPQGSGEAQPPQTTPLNALGTSIRYEAQFYCTVPPLDLGWRRLCTHF